MSALEDLYQEIILDHYRTPRNFRGVENANRSADGHNPLCGDRVGIELVVEGGKVVDVGFSGSGCAISTASASLMTEAVRGRPIEEVRSLIERFHALLTSPDPEESPEDLGKLGALAGVRRIPIRVKCATLAWHTLKSALAGDDETATTEEET